ncbi:MAG TPA: hypothetical protein PLS19_03880 [bacterium]|nr:hypothetical protein [bacterium]
MKTARMTGFILICVCFVYSALAGVALGETCAEGAKACSEEAYSAKRCEGGEWKVIECMKEEGKLCEAGACVEPWRYGAPVWPKAEDEPRATVESLAEKANRLEEQAVRLNIHPELKWMNGVQLPCAKVECAPGQTPPCLDCSKADPPEETATWRDVERWHSGENDGLWSGLYLGAQAFKYAVTKDEATLQNIKLLLDGEVTRMRITGVPGLFTRMFVPPGIPGLEAPEMSRYVSDPDKKTNNWVRIGDEGCVWTVSPETMQWVKSDHCGLEEFAGWSWLDNASKDEYSGHIFILSALSKLVDDEEVQAKVADLASKVGMHMIKNGMEFMDWDGKNCQFGRIRAGVLDDFAGFNAALALAFMKVFHTATNDERFDKWYNDCLLQRSGKWTCIKGKNEPVRDYSKYLPKNGLYRGPEGCYNNYDSVSMHMLAMFSLIWHEKDPELREIYQKSFDVDVVRPEGQPRAIIKQNNPWFNFMWAAMKKVGPGSDGHDYGAVDNAIRMMKQFPASKTQREVICPPDKCIHYCEDKSGRPTGNYARPMAERCMTQSFIWWGDPYSLRNCEDNPRLVRPPQDYLLPYWMGRYFGFIDEKM